MISNLLTLILSFGKIGLISLGGGNSMLKLIEVEAVDYRHWISNEEFINMLGSSFLFPGLTAVKLSALIGYKAAGILGLIFAVISINLPGLLLAAVGYQFLNQHSGPTIQKIMVPVQYGALVLLAATAFSVAQSIVNAYYSIPMVIMSMVFFLALTYLQLSPFWGFIAFIGICFFLVH
ncbi:chromate transporter [Legionella gresilensis]|uniref:chromate transporter n=1 Tax=Legionella gresilensis TaxID=91823 RepID=UPI001040E40A|nr:chromate transporter [Legionella gresilensis]